MALRFDAASGGTTDTPATSLTIAHTCAGANGLITVPVQIKNNGSQTVTGVTYNGVALTLKAAVNNGTNIRSELWYLVAPATGANNIVITASASTRFTGGGISFNGADQTTPLGTAATATGNDTAPSVAVSAASGDIVIDSMAYMGINGTGLPTASVGSGQTERFNQSATGGIGTEDKYVGGAGSTEAGAASVTMDWTLSDTTQWATIGVAVKPVSTPAATASGAALLMAML